MAIGRGGPFVIITILLIQYFLHSLPYPTSSVASSANLYGVRIILNSGHLFSGMKNASLGVQQSPKYLAPESTAALQRTVSCTSDSKPYSLTTHLTFYDQIIPERPLVLRIKSHSSSIFSTSGKEARAFIHACNCLRSRSRFTASAQRDHAHSYLFR